VDKFWRVLRTRIGPRLLVRPANLEASLFESLANLVTNYFYA
jgi:hypothetical protein